MFYNIFKVIILNAFLAYYLIKVRFLVRSNQNMSLK